MGTVLWWGGFVLLILFFLGLDLGVLHRHAREIKLREALFWTGFWISLALVFNAILFFVRGSDIALEFFTGYLLEKMISIDNLFVFVVVFSFFHVPKAYQHRALFFGMMGTLILRMGLIFAGVALLTKFVWAYYLFGFFLMVTGIYLFFQEREGIDLKHNLILRSLRKILPISHKYHGSQFVAKVDKKWVATPLLLAVLVIEAFDLFYSVESIPVIFAVTKDPFIVYTSNVFAILGLKSLYFVMAHFMYRFHYMRYALATVLIFVGFKMAIEPFFPISDWVILGVVVLSFVVTVILGHIFPAKGQAEKRPRRRR